jgi:hypothetical protein
MGDEHTLYALSQSYNINIIVHFYHEIGTGKWSIKETIYYPENSLTNETPNTALPTIHIMLGGLHYYPMFPANERNKNLPPLLTRAQLINKYIEIAESNTNGCTLPKVEQEPPCNCKAARSTGTICESARARGTLHT